MINKAKTNENIMLINSIFVLMLTSTDAYRILIVFPTPAISHRAVLIPLVHELLKRGHEVTVLSGMPSFQHTANLTEIVLDAQNKFNKELNRNDDSTPADEDQYSDRDERLEHIFRFVKVAGDWNNFLRVTLYTQIEFVELFEKTIAMPEIKELAKRGADYFDLLILESWIRLTLVTAHVFNAPVIQIQSAGSTVLENEAIGAPVHPTLYITQHQQRVYNLTLWEKLQKFYKYWQWQKQWTKLDEHFNKIIWQRMGEDVPPLKELACRVRMLIVNEHHIWAGNRPDPPSLVRVWGIHLQPTKPLPEELQNYLDSSTRGVIYMSLGTSHNSYFLPPRLIQLFTDALSRLPYDVLLKWDKDRLPSRPSNVRIGKWFPQADLLRHPKVLLFITQGGMQSTDEAIEAGVPLLGLPMFADQWFQAEHYVRFGIGEQLYVPTLTEQQLVDAVLRIINDPSYRHNIASLRTLLHDEPPPQGAARAAEHAEHVVRHAHVYAARSPAACCEWGEYLELELLGLVVLVMAGGVWVGCKGLRVIQRCVGRWRKVKVS